MSKKVVFLFIVLSFILNTVVAIIDALLRGNIIAGEAGFPVRSSSSAPFGALTTNYLNLFLDWVFWFIVIIGIWKIYFLFKKSK